MKVKGLNWCDRCMQWHRETPHTFRHDWKAALIGGAFILGVLLFAGLTQGCAAVSVQQDVRRPLREPNADDLQREDPPSLYCKQWPDDCTNIYDAKGDTHDTSRIPLRVAMH